MSSPRSAFICPLPIPLPAARFPGWSRAGTGSAAPEKAAMQPSPPRVYFSAGIEPNHFIFIFFNLFFFPKANFKVGKPAAGGAGAGWDGGVWVRNPRRRSAPCPGQPTEDGLPRAAGAAAPRFLPSFPALEKKSMPSSRIFGANRRNKTRTAVAFSPVPVAAGKPPGPFAAKPSPGPKAARGPEGGRGVGTPVRRRTGSRGQREERDGSTATGNGGRGCPERDFGPSGADTVPTASLPRTGRATGRRRPGPGGRWGGLGIVGAAPTRAGGSPGRPLFASTRSPPALTDQGLVRPADP